MLNVIDKYAEVLYLEHQTMQHGLDMILYFFTECVVSFK